MTLVIPRDHRLAASSPSRLSRSPPQQQQNERASIPRPVLPSPSHHIHPSPSLPPYRFFVSFHAPCFFFPAVFFPALLPLPAVSLSLFSLSTRVARPPTALSFPSPAIPDRLLLQNISRFCRQGFDIAGHHLHLHQTPKKTPLAALPTHIFTRLFSSTWRDHCFFSSLPFVSWPFACLSFLFSLCVSCRKPYCRPFPPRTCVCIDVAYELRNIALRAWLLSSLHPVWRLVT